MEPPIDSFIAYEKITICSGVITLNIRVIHVYIFMKSMLIINGLFLIACASVPSPRGSTQVWQSCTLPWRHGKLRTWGRQPGAPGGDRDDEVGFKGKSIQL